MLLPLLLLPALLQDPVEPAPESLPDPLPSPELQEVLKEVDRLADQVREGFLALDRHLRETRDQVEQAPAAEDEAAPKLADRIKERVAEADRLLADMEALLEAIPELENQGGGGSGSSRPRPRPEDGQEPRNLDASGERRQPQEPAEGDQESQTGEGPPRSSYLRLLFDQDNGAWGMLPPRLQEALRNAVIEDLPLRYRRWLDDYHRGASSSRR
ncbi:MAG: hypothetical protein D6702_02690 [Planctomycetota bacterium]|nr:MAG: hypothetical protein D6702_02690 [Planctomycetota bacterium]